MLDLSELISGVFEETDLPLNFISEEDEEESLTGLDRWGWWLSYLAKAYGRAERLVENRAAFHKELSKNVHHPAVNYGHVHKRGEAKSSTDAQAFRLINKKNRYGRRIEKEYRLHQTWLEVLDLCETEHDKTLLSSFFFDEKVISDEEINRILKKIYSPLIMLEQRIEEERNALAKLL